MPNDLINLVPKDAEELATFIEAVQTIRGASKAAQSAVTKHFGSAFERNWRHIAEKAKKLRDQVAPERYTEPSPSILIPLVNEACQEDRQELQDLWAALLANSMLDKGKKVRRQYIETLRQMEPVDVVVLLIFKDAPQHSISNNEPGRYLETRRVDNRILAAEWDVAINSLVNLGCLAKPGYNYLITSFGSLFVAACTMS